MTDLQAIADDLECIEAGFRWIERASFPPDPPKKWYRIWRESYFWIDWKVSSGVAHTMLRAFGDDNDNLAA